MCMFPSSSLLLPFLHTLKIKSPILRIFSFFPHCILPLSEVFTTTVKFLRTNSTLSYSPTTHRTLFPDSLSLQSTLYNPPYTIHTIQSTLYNPHYTIHTIQSTLYNPHYTIHTIQSTLYNPHSTIYNPHYTRDNPHYNTIHLILSSYTIHHILSLILSILNNLIHSI
jgi:hypothetical protein